jgi:DNA-binding response OmpR family regulator
MYRILCIEDSAEVQLLLKRSLAPYFEIRLAANLADGRKELASGSFDLLILDIGLPDGDGLRFCSELKTTFDHGEIPVFILTGSKSLQEKLLGFQLGIEDFIVKPFEPLEFKARIDSRLKKIADQRQQDLAIAIGNLRLNLASQRTSLVVNGQPENVDLSTTEFRILSFLVKNKERVKSREEIITAVWPTSLNLSDRTIDSHVSRIRKKLKNCDCMIEGIQNAGYRFSPVVSARTAV